MILAIDIGNSNIAFGISRDSVWLDHWRLRTDAEKTADEYLVLFQSLITASGHTIDAVERVVISSVVPALTTAIVQVTEKLFGQTPLLVSHSLATGLNPEKAVPGELGYDLLANAVAAYDRIDGPSIVVDFGTALSFTAVSGSGEILGVAIAPGLRSALGALAGNTAQLPTVDLVPPPHALGRTSVHAIQSGVVYGYVGLVKEVVARMAAEMEGKPFVVATGGLATTLVSLTDVIDEYRPWHTLEGLLVLARLNPLRS